MQGFCCWWLVSTLCTGGPRQAYPDYCYINLSVCFDSVLFLKGKFRRIGARSWLPFPRTSFCLKPKNSTKLWSTRVLDITWLAYKRIQANWIGFWDWIKVKVDAQALRIDPRYLTGFDTVKMFACLTYMYLDAVASISNCDLAVDAVMFFESLHGPMRR